MFSSGNFWNKINLVILENFEIAHVLLGQYQYFQKCTRVICPKAPSQKCDYYYKLPYCVYETGVEKKLKNEKTKLPLVLINARPCCFWWFP